MNKTLLMSIAGLGVGVGVLLWSQRTEAKAANVIEGGAGDKDPAGQYCPPGYTCDAGGEFASSPDFLDAPLVYLENKVRSWGESASGATGSW